MNKTLVTALAFAVSLSAVMAAASRFPSTDSNLRVGTPNDPSFDCNEPDDEDDAPCAKLFDQQINLLGFAPNASINSATYKDAARFGEGQISGVSADAAWKLSIGSSQVAVAILDTGIRWGKNNLRQKIRLNRFELPRPQGADGATLNNSSDDVFGGYDVNGDGSFNVEDYANDPRVDKSAGPDGVADLVDAQDLLKTFSDGSDADANGYIDDIAGWDFFEDDNDPSDTTSYSAADGHGTGRAEDAAVQTNDGEGDAGVCPRCMVLPLRVWDTFVAPGDTWAAATVYLADLGVQTQEVALGMLQNTRASKAANTYAFNKGVALMQVSSDLNTANHNYPTNYVESVYINGCVADVEGGGNEITGEIPGFGDMAEVPVLSWFRNSGLTQYGAHAHVCYHATTGSQATGQAAGGAGLIQSRGLEAATAIGGPLSSNEVKQILTMTAEDVLPENSVGVGLPDPAQVGFDEHFGYGRAHLGNALKAIAPGKIPPEALIQTPAWWAILDPGATASGKTFEIRGMARATRSTACTYTLEYAVGIEPTSYTKFGEGSCPAQQNALLGTLPMDAIATLITGSRTGTFAATGRPNPNQHMFTVRLVVQDGAVSSNRGEDRKVYLALHDPTWHTGWPKFEDVGGETSPVLYDLNGDGTLEFVDANSAGELCVFQHDGSKLPSFNGGQCWQLPPAFWYHPDAPGFKTGAVPPPSSGFRTPAIADLDGDFEPEIVAASADGRLYVIRNDGTVRLTLGVDLAHSTPDKRNKVDHPKRGFLGSPVLADLDGDGSKEIIAAALDGFIYVWNGHTGVARAGFPKEVREAVAPARLGARGELIQTPTIADLDGDGKLEIITGSADVIPAEAAPPSAPPNVMGGSGAIIDYVLANTAGGDTRIYAIKADGSFFPNWPVALTGLVPDVLPFVGPQHGLAAADLDDDGIDEVVGSMTTGSVQIFKANGSSTALTSNGVVVSGASPESSRIFNLFENNIVGDLNGVGQLDVAHLGITATGVANLLLTGQNFPFNYAMQVWDSQLPEAYAPGFPVAHDDFGLLSSPAIASVTGSGKHLIAGSGLYLLHAYSGTTGLEAAGFPKQTGGWMFAVPAIGDVDGDGKLNLAIGTREGYRFIWDLTAPTTQANNSEWWMQDHDECHTGNYKTDCRPPNRVKNLRYEGGALKFTAPGDDWAAGTVSKYQLRTATAPIVTATDYAAASTLPDISASAAGGSEASLPFDMSKSLGYVAIVPVDDAANRAKFISVGVGTPPPPPPGIVATASLTATSANATGDGGQSLDAGSFVLRHTAGATQSLSALTIQLGATGVVDRLSLTVAGQTLSVQLPADGSQAAFSFNPALTLAAGSTLPFTLQARLANGSGGSTSVALTALALTAGTTSVAVTGLPAVLALLNRNVVTSPPPAEVDVPVSGRFGSGALPPALLLPLLLLGLLRRRKAL